MTGTRRTQITVMVAAAAIAMSIVVSASAISIARQAKMEAAAAKAEIQIWSESLARDIRNLKGDLKDTKITLYHMTHPSTASRRFIEWGTGTGEFASMKGAAAR
jgi:hypothetical protein